MALVCKARGVRNLSERGFGGNNLVGGKLKSQAAHVFTDRATILLPKDTREVRGMNSRRAGDIVKRQIPAKIFVEKIFSFEQPGGNFLAGGGLARHLAEQFINQTF